MHRRTFLFAAPLAAVAAPATIDVALLTQVDGPHLSAYLEGLALAPEVGKVFVADAAVEPAARKALGGKFAAAYPSAKALLAAHKPPLALIPMEATLAPPVIHAALDAGCHVMAEKPACVRAEDFAPLAAKANAKKLHLNLAFANRIDPTFKEARRIIQSGALGKLYGMEMHLIADQNASHSPGLSQDLDRAEGSRRRRPSHLARHPLARYGQLHYRIKDHANRRLHR